MAGLKVVWFQFWYYRVHGGRNVKKIHRNEYSDILNDGCSEEHWKKTNIDKRRKTEYSLPSESTKQIGAEQY